MNLKDENANFNYIFTEKPLIFPEQCKGPASVLTQDGFPAASG